jgi:predicted RNA-binding Zn-ribbon protein involved in translation (DUF1610 family)
MFNKNEIMESYTLERCGSCEKELKRKFSKGDFVFKIVSKCPSCQGQVIITKIFADTLIP